MLSRIHFILFVIYQQITSHHCFYLRSIKNFKSTSIVMRIKTEFYKEITPEITGKKLKGKLRKFWTDWLEASNFDAICNHEDSKLTINKSKIRNALKAIIGIILKTTNSDIDQKFTVGEKTWFTDLTLHIFIHAMISCNIYLSAMYTLPVNVLAEIVNSNSKVFDKGDN